MQIREIRRDSFLWIDIINPSKEDLEKIGKDFNLDPATIQDCMEAEHLPKYELMGDTTFIILRAYDLEADKKSDTIQATTNKVAIFFSAQFLISIHRKEQNYITHLFDKINADPKTPNLCTHLVANDIMYRVTKTYGTALDNVYADFDTLEADTFNKGKKVKLVKTYLLKRRIDIIKRMLSLMKEPLSGLTQSSPPAMRSAFRNTREFLEKMNHQANVFSDNLTSLMSLQISIQSQITNEASHRTNEVMRVLTVFSIFFMPLNFIVGMYGMNFDNMPALHSEWGFWLTMLFMFCLTCLIFIWFNRKGWLKGASKPNF